VDEVAPARRKAVRRRAAAESASCVLFILKMIEWLAMVQLNVAFYGREYRTHFNKAEVEPPSKIK